MKKQIQGVVTNKTDKWLTVKIDGYKATHSDFVFVNPFSSYLNVGDHFSLFVSSKQKKINGGTKWFHIPEKHKANAHVVLGIGTEEMVFQPCIGNIIVKGNHAYRVKHCEKCSNGFGYGYFCEFWWKITCEDITVTEQGKKAIKEQIK